MILCVCVVPSKRQQCQSISISFAGPYQVYPFFVLRREVKKRKSQKDLYRQALDSTTPI